MAAWPMNQSPLLVIVGETASGKSALALDIAKKYNGEIINADSWSVYREFDIGTAKPTKAEMAQAPHHLFDIVDAPDGFNASLYKDKALMAIQSIAKKGKLPIIVGGTGLYVDSILYDFEFLPPGKPGERERLSELSMGDLLAEAEAEEISLEGIDIRNKRRVIRALEAKGKQPTRKLLRENTLIIGLSTPRDLLRERIESRVDTMLQTGLEAEVALLAENYGWDTEPMKGIGYREWRDYFLGSQTMEQTRQRIISGTMNLAKRQRTWFKRNSSIQWINNRDEYVDILTTFLNKNR